MFIFIKLAKGTARSLIQVIKVSRLMVYKPLNVCMSMLAVGKLRMLRELLKTREQKRNTVNLRDLISNSVTNWVPRERLPLLE